MHYRVYVDVLFIVNFVMDFIVLQITSGLLRLTTTYFRKILAALLGATWSVLVTVLELRNPLWSFITYFIVSTAMVITMEKTWRIRELVKRTAALYLATFSLAGMFYALYYFTSFGYFLHTVSVDIWLLAAGSIIGIPLLRLAYRTITDIAKLREFRMTAKLEYQGKKLILPALCDTGNALYDPIYNEPVNVAEASCIQKMITSYDNCGYHLIPYSAIGTENGLIPVVRMERLILISGRKTQIINKPLIALYAGQFAKSTGYKIIIHPENYETKVERRNKCI